MGELRDKMDRDMMLKNLSDRTRKTYLCCVRDFVRFHRRDPKELGDEQIKAFLHHLIVEKKVSQSTVSQAYSALKFFYVVTLEREWNETGIPRGRRTYKLAGSAFQAGGGSDSRCHGQPEVPYDFRDDLFGGVAYSRGDRSGSHRYRLAAHDDPGTPGQGPKGPLHAAFPAQPGAVVALLAPGATARVCVLRSRQKSRNRSIQHSAPIPPFDGQGGDRQEGFDPHVASQFCDPPAGSRLRHLAHPEAVGPPQPVDDGDLPACAARQFGTNRQPTGGSRQQMPRTRLIVCRHGYPSRGGRHFSGLRPGVSAAARPSDAGSPLSGHAGH